MASDFSMIPQTIDKAIDKICLERRFIKIVGRLMKKGEIFRNQIIP
jgi:hypothetical protein